LFLGLACWRLILQLSRTQVVNEDLAPTQSHIALVVVNTDAVPADLIAKKVARRCSDYPN
jgi:hypothetical protein